MPTATDLVTDLPADFEVFGQAVATSMADLLGGTSGQVLAKNSNTDMDFVWVTSDDANAIQNAIVDAKGDLIAATAADTPARLAVGGNFAFLQADSAQSTGLKWNLDGSTNYTPTITAAAGTITTTNNVSGSYIRVGKLCWLRVNIGITTNGTGAGTVIFTLPFTNVGNTSVGVFRETAVTGNSGAITIAGGTSTGFMANYNNGYPGANGVNLVGTVVYEVA